MTAATLFVLGLVTLASTLTIAFAYARTRDDSLAAAGEWAAFYLLAVGVPWIQALMGLRHWSSREVAKAYAACILIGSLVAITGLSLPTDEAGRSSWGLNFESLISIGISIVVLLASVLLARRFRST